MRNCHICRALTCLLLTALMICACVLPGLAMSPGRLTAQEKKTERLVEDALAQNRSAVLALRNGHAYKVFLDTVAARQKTWVKQETARMMKELKEQGISIDATVKELRVSKDPEKKTLYRDLCHWLVDETKDSSVLAYSLFTTPAAIDDFDLSQLVFWSALQDFVDSVVPELLREALETLLRLGIDLGFELPWPVLDQKKIVDYAHKYAKKYNPAYRVPESGSDCTNFVSQALYAGGLFMTPGSVRGTNPGTATTTEKWYYYNSLSATADTPYEQAVAVSTSWVRVTDLYTYLAPHYETFYSTSTKAVAENLKEGYVIQGGPTVGRYEHSSIVTQKNGKWCYTAHTNDRKDRDIQHYFNAYDKFRIIKVC